MTTRVRDLRNADLSSIAWSGSPLHVANVAKQLARAEAGEVQYLAILADDEIVGIGGIDYAKTPDVATIWQLSVSAEHQSNGYGSQLIAALENRAERRGERVIELSVEIENERAAALYERLGYQVVGRADESWEQQNQDGTIETHHADCLVMRKTLSGGS